MNTKLKVSALAIALGLATTLHAQQQPPRAPMVQEGGAMKISDHVFVISDNSVPGVPNVGIVVGSKGILVVDTGLGKKNGEIVMAEVHRVAKKDPQYLVTTHVHPEHDLGAGAFPASTKMIRSKDQVTEIAEAGMTTADAFRGRSEVMKNLLEGAEFRNADITFDKDYSLDLGGVKIKLFAMGPNHTPGDTAILVETDSVVFAGDIAMKALPAFASPKASLNQWLKSLDKLDSMKAKIVVPSHGPIGDPSYMANYRQYLTAVRDRTAALKAEGKTLEQVTPIVSGELKEKYSDTGRMTGAIRVAYAEAK